MEHKYGIAIPHPSAEALHEVLVSLPSFYARSSSYGYFTDGRTRKHSGVRGMTIGLLLSPCMLGSLWGSMLGLLSQSAAYQLNPPDWLQVALRATRSQSGNL